jgi:hypothetical protein
MWLQRECTEHRQDTQDTSLGRRRASEWRKEETVATLAWLFTDGSERTAGIELTIPGIHV